jgi:hypothetical protein
LILSISLSKKSISQNLDCTEHQKRARECEKVLDSCYSKIGKIYEACKKELKKDRELIIKQQKLITDLDDRLGKDRLKHTAQGAGGASLVFLLLLIFL